MIDEYMNWGLIIFLHYHLSHMYGVFFVATWSYNNSMVAMILPHVHSALKVFLIYKLFLQNKNLALYKHSVNFMAP